MTTPRIGSLCTGYGGLDTAVQQVFGGELAWVADNDPGTALLVAHRHPHIPNLGDLTATDWGQVAPVDILTAGYPCQPFSSAGLRKGTADERHIWPHIADAIGVLRPRHIVLENVAGHLRRGFDAVLGDLARLGFDAEWCTVRASEVGAPHRRERLFVLAVAADASHLGHERSRGARDRRTGSADGGVAPADPGSPGLEVRAIEHHGPQRQAAERGRGEPAPHTDGHAIRQQSVGLAGRSRAAVAGRSRPEAAADADGLGRGQAERDIRPGKPDAAWGPYAPAIRRWEHATGRPAPRATDDRGRLSPAFVEWLMGLPAGHVTAVPGLTRNQQLKALGNGVVPQQAAAAVRLLLNRAAAPAAA